MATNPLQRITFGGVVFTLLLSIIVAQVFTKLSSFFFKTGDYRFGWIITLLVILLSVGTVFSIFFRSQGAFDRKNIVVILLITGLAVLTVIYMPKLVPEIFSALPIYSDPVTSQGLEQLQSAISP